MGKRRLLLCLLLALSCGPQDTTGRAEFLLCRAASGESCPDDTGELRAAPALFSHSWSEHGDNGIVISFEFPVFVDGEDDVRSGLLWLDLDLEGIVPGGRQVLSRNRWEASYVEHRGGERVFGSESARGHVIITDFDLIGDLPPALQASFDLTLEAGDGSQVRVDGELRTAREPRVIEHRVNGHKVNPDVDVCINCYYGCGGPDGYGEDAGGCGGEDESETQVEAQESGCGGEDSGSGSSESGCNGESSGSDPETGDGGCGDGDGGGDGCEGDASAAAGPPMKRGCSARGISLPRLLDLILPMVLGVLLRLRRRR